MSLINISQLNYSIGTDDILVDVSCIVEAKDRIGIVGVNGAGKSTLLKLIMGAYKPSLVDSGEAYEANSGEFAFQKDLSIGYLKQREHFKAGVSVWNALDCKLSPEEFEKKNGYSLEKGKRGILNSLGFGEETYTMEAVSLSGGEQTRLALGAVLLQDPDLLLLDEPTNHLDIPTLNWLENRLKSYKGSIMIVSHDRYFLDSVCTKIFEIENCELTTYKGNYTEYKEKKRIRYEEDLKHYEQQQAEIKRQEELITRWHERNTEHLVKRAQSREKRLAMIERLAKPQQLKEEIKLCFKENLKTGNDVAILENLAFAFSDAPDRFLFTNLNSIIKRGDRICITGPNGAGKTTLLKMLLGKYPPSHGRIILGTNVVIAYYDQQQENLNPNNTVLSELYNCPGVIIGPGEYASIESRYTETELRKMLGAFCFHGDEVFKKVSDLAGGEKARLSLLKLMMSGANVLLLDEPTNHLDISSKEVFEDALLAYPGTEIIVSHDRYLIDRVATKMLEIGTGNLGSFGDKKGFFAENCPNILREPVAAANGSLEKEYVKGSEEERQAKKRAETERRRNEKKLAEAEKLLAQLEEKKTELENLLCSDEVFSDLAKSRQVSEELKEIQAQLDEAYAAWLKLAEG